MSRSGGRKLNERDLIAAIGQRPDIRLFLLFGTDPSTIEDIARKLSAEMKKAERLESASTAGSGPGGASWSSAFTRSSESAATSPFRAPDEYRPGDVPWSRPALLLRS